jgi:hypothetical protein
LRAEGVALGARAHSVTLDVLPGQGWAIVGSRQRDADALYAALTRLAEPFRGSVEAHLPSPDRFPERRRGALGAIFKRMDGLASARSLTALGLWSELDRDVSSFDAESAAAVRCAHALAQPGRLLTLGRLLDPLAPGRLAGALGLLDELLSEGAAAVCATCRADVAERMGHIVAMRGPEPAFVGSAAELIQRTGASEVVVETEDPSTVATMAEPFALRVTAQPGELRIQAADGQSLAARLLTEGYGRIRAVTVRSATLQDALTRAL